ncbi:hypothetical protein GGX14DRAFT_388815 [Mycena pura]|uniref:Uncharacterized protein n=1 Tax=Mycena pura TaxID=153505 RepID=A0AAD6YKA3_9AGAR|nr:hypothetical protein GGX14DRAFT_388815 [Mycena pura]
MSVAAGPLYVLIDPFIPAPGSSPPWLRTEARGIPQCMPFGEIHWPPDYNPFQPEKTVDDMKDIEACLQQSPGENVFVVLHSPDEAASWLAKNSSHPAIKQLQPCCRPIAMQLWPGRDALALFNAAPGLPQALAKLSGFPVMAYSGANPGTIPSYRETSPSDGNRSRRPDSPPPPPAPPANVDNTTNDNVEDGEDNPPAESFTMTEELVDRMANSVHTPLPANQPGGGDPSGGDTCPLPEHVVSVNLDITKTGLELKLYTCTSFQQSLNLLKTFTNVIPKGQRRGLNDTDVRADIQITIGVATSSAIPALTGVGISTCFTKLGILSQRAESICLFKRLPAGSEDPPQIRKQAFERTTETSLGVRGGTQGPGHPLTFLLDGKKSWGKKNAHEVQDTEPAPSIKVDYLQYAQQESSDSDFVSGLFEYRRQPHPIEPSTNKTHLELQLAVGANFVKINDKDESISQPNAAFIQQHQIYMWVTAPDSTLRGCILSVSAVFPDIQKTTSTMLIKNVNIKDAAEDESSGLDVITKGRTLIPPGHGTLEVGPIRLNETTPHSKNLIESVKRRIRTAKHKLAGAKTMIPVVAKRIVDPREPEPDPLITIGWDRALERYRLPVFFDLKTHVHGKETEGPQYEIIHT